DGLSNNGRPPTRFDFGFWFYSDQKNKTKVNTPSVSRKNRAAATSVVTTSRFAQIRKTLIWLSGRLGEGGFKSINRRLLMWSRFSQTRLLKCRDGAGGASRPTQFLEVNF
ncbi:hypothetical protein, partial [Cloacibacillus evryensis]